MKNTVPATILIGLLLFGCNQTDKKPASAPAQPVVTAAPDPEQIQQLVRRLYEWNETKNSNDDLEPIAVDSVYVGLDLEKHAQRVQELKSTGLFADEFLANYDKVVLAVDAGLKSKKLGWNVGELPDFSADANPWCNCQDTPSETYWRDIQLVNLQFNKNAATFDWTWGGNFKYRTKAVKQDGEWKIAYLEGFDEKEFILTGE